MNTQLSKIRWSIGTALLGTALLFPAFGISSSAKELLGSDKYEDHRDDERNDLSDQVLRWVKEGKVIPFKTLKERYKDRLEGRLLDLEVEREHGRIIYELELMRADSVVYEIKIDAQNGEWLEEEEED